MVLKKALCEWTDNEEDGWGTGSLYDEEEVTLGDVQGVSLINVN